MNTTYYRKETITVSDGNEVLRGDAYIPVSGKKRYPVVICSHVLGADRRSMRKYGAMFASRGIAACCFDFRGCGESDGDPLKMSLLSEAGDLQVILSAAKDWDFADPDKIMLLGESQGGAASAAAAAENSGLVRGLILCFPAFIIHDAVHEEFRTEEEVPASFFFRWLTVGSAYVLDVWDYDIYGIIGNYTGPVLLLHGDQDHLVPLMYSQRAAEVYPDVRFEVVEGAGHQFKGDLFEKVSEIILSWMEEKGIK